MGWLLMIPTDPSFGAGFNADEFRNAIIQTMIMGMPNAVEEQASFCWRVKKQFDTADPAGNPYDWSDAPSASSPQDKAPVIVPVALEFVSRASLGSGTPMGVVENPKVIVTVMDTQFRSIMAQLLVLKKADNYPKTSVSGFTPAWISEVYHARITQFNQPIAPHYLHQNNPSIRLIQSKTVTQHHAPLFIFFLTLILLSTHKLHSNHAPTPSTSSGHDDSNSYFDEFSTCINHLHRMKQPLTYLHQLYITKSKINSKQHHYQN